MIVTLYPPSIQLTSNSGVDVGYCVIVTVANSSVNAIAGSPNVSVTVIYFVPVAVIDPESANKSTSDPLIVVDTLN